MSDGRMQSALIIGMSTLCRRRFANVGAGLLKSVDNEFRTVHLCRVAVVEIIVEQHPLSYKVAVPFVQP